MLLDQEGGPNHGGNFCDVTFLYDLKKKDLLQRNIYDYVWHFSHFITEGSVRIGSSIYTDALDSVAFMKEDKVVFVLLNRSKEEIPLMVKLKNYCGEFTVPPLSILTGELSGA